MAAARPPASQSVGTAASATGGGLARDEATPLLRPFPPPTPLRGAGASLGAQALAGAREAGLSGQGEEGVAPCPHPIVRPGLVL